VPEEGLVLLEFLQIVLMCVFQERLSQMVTPRYMYLTLLVIRVWCIAMDVHVIWRLYRLPGYVDHLTFIGVEVHLTCVFPFLEIIKVLE
jgi:hypothetical protein